ncbi:olfactory receptor 2A1/2A42-like [Monodelphis domestica]|uniref:olfactory receptor 2A1/2A42-like n=1 Tax=Monodelphis domestica TaxID=13616 RepID=UPI00020F75FF|nr:olfactory receptor 2A1/2A42-like [Monodelphis domestica]
MEDNQTMVTEFILLGFVLGPKMKMFLFGLFSLFYTLTLLGNAVILGLICLDSRLHSPMYFFLSHLAIVDISYASNTVPPLLGNHLDPVKPISFAGCLTQTFFFLTFALTECLLLLVMSYDRYVAICHPLRYSVIMNWKVCTALAITPWGSAAFLALVNVILILRVPFCGNLEVNHFFCELLSILRLTCANIWVNQVMVFITSFLFLLGPFCLVLVSYMRIIWAILRIQSGEGRKKAFSTCSSHLCVVGLYFGSGIAMYMIPNSSNPEQQKKILSLFYSFFNPTLNPLIYSLRNAEVKGALRRVLGKERPK